MYKFINKYGYGEPFIYIHPYRQKAVKYAVDNVFDWVLYIVVFGSSINTTCKFNSDIDMCLIGKPSSMFDLNLLRLQNESYDFILVESEEELFSKASLNNQNIYKNILENGVIVYDKYRLTEKSRNRLENGL